MRRFALQWEQSLVYEDLSYFMRLVLTLAFLAAASLNGAELDVPVSKAVTPTGPLSLEKAIDRTLLFNLGLTVTRLDALRSLDVVEASLSRSSSASWPAG